MNKIRTLAVAVVMAVAMLAAVPGHAAAGQSKPAATMQKMDPCFFTEDEFWAWYNGPRWGQSLGGVESDANCTGTWLRDDAGNIIQFHDWFGKTVQARTWPRRDGGETRIWFAYPDGGPWKAHDMGKTWGLNFADLKKVCEWPRPDGDPC